MPVPAPLTKNGGGGKSLSLAFSKGKPRVAYNTVPTVRTGPPSGGGLAGQTKVTMQHTRPPKGARRAVPQKHPIGDKREHGCKLLPERAKPQSSQRGAQ